MNLNEKDFEKLNKLGIECLILCGSQAQKVVNNKSDYDFLVLGPKNQKTYDILYDMLSEKINKLTDIDIVFECFHMDGLYVLGQYCFCGIAAARKQKE